MTDPVSKAPARIAAVQLTSGIDANANLANIDAALSAARTAGADMAFLPEMAILLDRDRSRSASVITTQDSSPWPQALAALAARHAIALHAGSAPFLDEARDRRVNRSLVFDAKGGLIAQYDKVHMFDVDLPTGESWRESAAYQGGDRIALADTPVGCLGMSICFDLRFAELYRALVDRGAAAIAIPAAFTVPTGAAHWHILLRARAIETGCFVIAAAQSGHHDDGRQTYGHSLVVDPWGTVLADGGEGNDRCGFRLAIADIDPASVAKVRGAVPMATSRNNRHIIL